MEGMQLTIRELLVAVDSGALKRLAQQPIPAVGAWKLRRIMQLLMAEYGPANEARMGLITDENSLPVNGGQGRMVKPEFVAAFEADPVFAQTVEIKADPIALEMLANATISAADMDLIAPLLQD